MKRVNRWVSGISAVWVMVMALGGWTFPRAAAQEQTGVICVTTYADTNANGQRDSDEGVLAGVNVNLSTGGVIIATHITEAGEDVYCFENLLRGVYTITFTDSLLYRTTTASEGTFALDGGQRLTIDPFGAYPVGLEGLRAEVASQVAAKNAEKPLTMQLRLLLAMVGSLLAMLFMIGVGAVLLGLNATRRGRRDRAGAPSVPLPTLIKPPRF